jgi:hypothetical protein
MDRGGGCWTLEWSIHDQRPCRRTCADCIYKRCGRRERPVDSGANYDLGNFRNRGSDHDGHRAGPDCVHGAGHVGLDPDCVHGAGHLGLDHDCVHGAGHVGLDHDCVHGAGHVGHDHDCVHTDHHLPRREHTVRDDRSGEGRGASGIVRRRPGQLRGVADHRSKRLADLELGRRAERLALFGSEASECGRVNRCCLDSGASDSADRDNQLTRRDAGHSGVHELGHQDNSGHDDL